jgi:hypothetical protein
MPLKIRPRIEKIIIVKNTRNISLRVFLSVHADPTNTKLSTPLDQITIKSYQKLKIKIMGLCSDQKIYSREFDCDKYDALNIQIPVKFGESEITSLQLYEVNFTPGIEFFLGSFLPLVIDNNSKVLICDFDKTLIETRFHTTKDLINSLRSPLSSFPAINQTVDLVHKLQDLEYKIFILSASPHFYEKLIRDWLYQNKILTGHILLKDYRKIFSLSDLELTTKDIKTQGYYKISELIKTLIMTGIPQELTLIGDGFEADETIYLTLRALIYNAVDPWLVWQKIKNIKSFDLNAEQETKLLGYFQRLFSLPAPFENQVTIYIRCTKENIEQVKKRKLGIDFLENQRQIVNYYCA